MTDSREIKLLWTGLCHDCDRFLNYSRWRRDNAKVRRFIPRETSTPVLAFPLCNKCYSEAGGQQPAVLLGRVEKEH